MDINDRIASRVHGPLHALVRIAHRPMGSIDELLLREQPRPCE